jgi:hypothetical protein
VLENFSFRWNYKNSRIKQLERSKVRMSWTVQLVRAEIFIYFMPMISKGAKQLSGKRFSVPEREATKVGMKFRETKTNYMIANQKRRNDSRCWA